MDVHPPLAKLLLTLAGWLAGFDGEFDFKEIGKDYVEPGVPYVAMRLLPALMGVMTIPTIFLTLKATGCRTMTAAMGAGLVIFENGLLTQSRLILLDSPLIIFTAFTALAWTCFTNQHEQGPSKAFDASWWFWLVATGLGLGATVSVKWVGLFTIAWVGSLTVVQLWVLLGDTVTVTPVGLLQPRVQQHSLMLPSESGSSTSLHGFFVSSLSLLLSIWGCSLSTLFASSTQARATVSCPPNSRQR